MTALFISLILFVGANAVLTIFIFEFMDLCYTKCPKLRKYSFIGWPITKVCSDANENETSRNVSSIFLMGLFPVWLMLDLVLLGELVIAFWKVKHEKQITKEDVELTYKIKQIMRRL